MHVYKHRLHTYINTTTRHTTLRDTHSTHCTHAKNTLHCARYNAYMYACITSPIASQYGTRIHPSHAYITSQHTTLQYVPCKNKCITHLYALKITLHMYINARIHACIQTRTSTKTHVYNTRMHAYMHPSNTQMHKCIHAHITLHRYTQ